MNNNTILQKLKKFVFRKLRIGPIEEKLRIQANQIRELQIALIGATSDQYKAESLYIQKNGVTVFPYQLVKDMPPIEGGFDKALKLPYVIHKGKGFIFLVHIVLINVTRCMKVILVKNASLAEHFVKNNLINILQNLSR